MEMNVPRNIITIIIAMVTLVFDVLVGGSSTGSTGTGSRLNFSLDLALNRGILNGIL